MIMLKTKQYWISFLSPIISGHFYFIAELGDIRKKKIEEKLDLFINPGWMLARAGQDASHAQPFPHVLQSNACNCLHELAVWLGEFV